MYNEIKEIMSDKRLFTRVGLATIFLTGQIYEGQMIVRSKERLVEIIHDAKESN